MGTKLDCSVLEQALATKMVFNEAGQSRPLHSAIPAKEGLFLQNLIRKHRPVSSLEVGCAYGVSSIFICKALREVGAREHVVIDPYSPAQYFSRTQRSWRSVGGSASDQFHNLSMEYRRASSF